LQVTSSTAEKKREGAISRYIHARLSKSRLCHIRATCEAARELALRHKVDPGRAALAALLHDAARGMSDREMTAYARKHRVPVPDKEEVIRRHPSLLHSYIAAHMAKDRFGVTDKGVLNAVACHTLGAARMDALSKIIYLSDAIAERDYPGVKKLWKTASRDLDTALRMAMAGKIRHVLSRKEWLHPMTIKAWNSLL
jgi:putative HD superfamily hydrolase of NAD metabolism